ncbi:MAG: sensor histidine kinase [Sarcina sp.]
MGTKWTENRASIASITTWFKNYSLSVRSIENFIILLLLIFIPIASIIFSSGKYVNGKYIKYYDAIINSEEYMNTMLTAEATELNSQIDKKIPLLLKLREEKIPKDHMKTLDGIQGIKDIGVVIFDSSNQRIYSNKPWIYDLAVDFKNTDQIIKAIESETGVIAQKGRKEEGFEEVYFTRTELYLSEIKNIGTLATMSTIALLILLILAFKKVYMIKDLGIKLYRDSLRWGYLHKIQAAVITLLKRNLIFNEVLKDRVVWIVLSFIMCASISILAIESVALEEMIIYINIIKLFIFTIAPILLIGHFMMKMLYRYEAIEFVTKNLKSIEMGNFDIEVRYDDDVQIRKLSKGINDIRRGYKTAIEERVYSEKMKTELISNVSHDLKTPLTSIINYVNIIQREDISEEERAEYIDILDRKSTRLKDLIEDLFEVSKMNSGKIRLEKYDIDIVQLLHQSIAELEDYNTDKHMEFKIKGVDELIVYMDGMRMSRVFQNLGTNALKYGLDNTRVYISVQDIGNDVEISFKNISEFELDFDSKDIVERFYRGDKSRNSDIEGSGLGLAITKSIIELHDGLFKVECEGDLFKAYIIIPKKETMN